MKLTTGILAITMMAGAAWAQNPNIVDKVNSDLKSVQQKKTDDVNAALQTTATGAASKPAAGTAATKQSSPIVVKPAAAPGKQAAPVVGKSTSTPAKSSSPFAVKTASAQGTKPVVKPAVASTKPVVTPAGSSTQNASSSASKTAQPAKMVVTPAAKASSPTAKVVVAPAKTAATPSTKPPASAAKVVVAPAKTATSAKIESAGKPASGANGTQVKITPKVSAQGKEAKPVVTPIAKADAAASEAKAPKPEDKKWSMTGKRDPFFSPVVQQSGSGCTTGKKCLEIGQINLRGVVKSDSGFIAVVTNNLNKAYFLRENDPVFNGYVVRITGDSVVFQETVQDKLGKTFTREVVKRIFTPAV